MKNRVLNSLISYIFKEKRAISLLLVISMVSSGIAVIQPLLMQQLIDGALLVKDLDKFYQFIFLIIAISIISIALSVFLQYRYTELSVRVLYSLRADIFEKIFLNNKLFFQRNRVGDLLSRLEGDISELQRFGVDSVFALFSAILGLIGATVIMFFYDASLAIFALLLFPLEFYLLKPMYSKMHDVTKELRQSSSIIGSFVIESLRYANFLKKFSAIKSRKESLKLLQKGNKDVILKQQVIQIKFAQIPLLIALFARVLLLLFGGLKVINGDISLGALIAFLSYFSMVLSPVHTILGILNNIPKLKVSIARLDEIIPKSVGNRVIKKLDKNINIEFIDLTFSYENTPLLFEKLNLKIEAKQKVVLIGNNGVGKSTLVDLLLNNMEPNSGEILLNSNSIKKIDYQTLQNSIALVEQKPVILATSLKENLMIANMTVSDEKLIDVLKKVELLSWFNSLKDGLNTILSEDGQDLSGGQMQRLSLARAILKEPSIIILDEPTSSQDREFIKQIDRLIDENFKDSTRIIISHHICFKDARYLLLKDKNIQEFKDE